MKTTGFSSIHTHTVFCDGRDDVETMCKTAFLKGLCAIGFSAHGPILKKTGLKTGWHMPDENLDKYIDEVLAARRRWQGKLPVYLGLELDFIKGMRSVLDSDIKTLNLDYIIGSVHYIVPQNGTRPFTVDGPREEFEAGLREGFGGDMEALLNSYWEAMAQMIALGGFDILGHVDLYKNNYLGFCGTESESRSVAEIAQAAARCGIAVEVNTGGLNRNRIDQTFPSSSLLSLFCRQKVPAIVTSDAHSAGDLDGHYDIALNTMIEAGYTEHSLFQGKENGKAIWRSEKIVT